MFRTAAVTAATVALLTLAGCGSAESVNDEELAEFTKSVQAEVPYMERYDPDSNDTTRHFRDIASSVCDGLDEDRSYAQLSETVAAYIDKSASDGEVDQVIAIAVETGCPESEDLVTP